jgi:hypothetical protein
LIDAIRKVFSIKICYLGGALSQVTLLNLYFSVFDFLLLGVFLRPTTIYSKVYYLPSCDLRVSMHLNTKIGTMLIQTHESKNITRPLRGTCSSMF